MESLLRQIDIYCERIDPSYWAEPINALTNGAFLVAAFIMYRRFHRHGSFGASGQAAPLATTLCVVLAAIGIGSYLFHTHAQVWSALADVVPIAIFILLYLYVVNRYYLGLARWVSLTFTVAFMPYTYLATPLFEAMPFFQVSSFYWPVALLLFIYGAVLLRSHAAVARGAVGKGAVGKGLLLAGGLFCLSLVFRSIDQTVCIALPLGTHFLWHILNGILLGWLIEVYRRFWLTHQQAV